MYILLIVYTICASSIYSAEIQEQEVRFGKVRFGNNSEHSALSSHWSASQLVSVATRDYRDDVRRGSREVYLDETGEEIQLLNSFFKLNEEAKRKLLTELPIVEHATLQENLN